MNPEMDIYELKIEGQLMAGSQNAPIEGTQGNGSALAPEFDFDE